MTIDDMIAIVKPHSDKIVAEARLAKALREIELLRAEVEMWKERWANGRPTK